MKSCLLTLYSTPAKRSHYMRQGAPSNTAVLVCLFVEWERERRKGKRDKERERMKAGENKIGGREKKKWRARKRTTRKQAGRDRRARKWVITKRPNKHSHQQHETNKNEKKQVKSVVNKRYCFSPFVLVSRLLSQNNENTSITDIWLTQIAC